MIDDGTRAALIVTAELVGLKVITQEERERIDDRLMAVWEIRNQTRDLDTVETPRSLLSIAAAYLRAFQDVMTEDLDAEIGHHVNEIREALEILARKEG